jgi:hypothetical protein
MQDNGFMVPIRPQCRRGGLAQDLPMSPGRSDSFSESDYQAIAAAISETERGRWFLSEFARRSRSAETMRVVDAIKLLEASLSRRVEGRHATPDRRSHRAAAERIGERLLDFAWHLRESGFDTALCDALDRDAHAIVSILTATGETAAAAAAPSAAQTKVVFEKVEERDPRLAALERLDLLPLIEKLSIFS